MIKKHGLTLIVATLFLAVACGQSNNATDTTAASGGVTVGGGSGGGSTPSTAAASVSVSVNPATITVQGSSTVTVTVLNSAGANVSNGTIVTFALSDANLGTITSQATTVTGAATATFTASSSPGTVVVTATSNSISNTGSITISAADTGSIQYSTASSQTLGLKGSGQSETSTITFLVKDVNGDPVVDGISVTFTMSGPSGGKLPANGGEYIGDLDSTPATGSASTANSGQAVIRLNSGAVAGPVTIVATTTINSITISSSSAVISIGGGAPSAPHFNIATTKINIGGFAVSGLTETITAYIADRFGNYNVLEGTSVSFYTEAGAIDRSNITDDTGKTSVTFRTQNPNPADVVINEATYGETTLITRLNTTYSAGITTGHPRDGWLTVFATVQGEEGFLDENGNGLFNRSYATTACPTNNTCECDDGTNVSGGVSCPSRRSEGFTDLGEPFYDKNDSGTRDDGSGTDPFEEFIDGDGDGSYDGANGVWDGPGCTGTGCLESKTIWDEIKLAYTHNPSCFIALSSCTDGTDADSVCSVAGPPYIVENGGILTFAVMVGDFNSNYPVSGTAVSFSLDGGGKLTSTDFTLSDGLPNGPVEPSFFLSDADAATDTSASGGEIALVTVEVIGGAASTSGGTVGDCARSVSAVVY